MTILVDTNILLRLTQARHPQYSATVLADEEAISGGHEIRIVPQVLYEFWVVATRAAKENGLGFSVIETTQHAETFKRAFGVLRDERGVLERWETLVQNHQVRGKPAHDARIVAAMLRHGVTQIITWNSADFLRYPEIAVIDPKTAAEPGT